MLAETTFAHHSERKRLTHLATVFAETFNWSAAAAFVRPPSITFRTMASRPFGVRGAFLWVSIRCSGHRLSFDIFSFLVQDRMDNLLKAHI